MIPFSLAMVFVLQLCGFSHFMGSVATYFVVEDIAKNLTKDLAAGLEGNGKPPNGTTERKQLSSVSTALLLAVGIGIFKAVALSLASGPFLNLMGIPSGTTDYVGDNKATAYFDSNGLLFFVDKLNDLTKYKQYQVEEANFGN